MRSKARTALTAPLVLLRTRFDKCGTPTKRPVTECPGYKMSRLPNVHFTKRPKYKTSRTQNVQVTKRPFYKTSKIQNVQYTKRPVFVNLKTCLKKPVSQNISDIAYFMRCIETNGQHKAGSTAAIRLPIGYRRLNQTYPNIKSAHTHGPHDAWTEQRMGVTSAKLG
jgi:hypothetical protein